MGKYFDVRKVFRKSDAGKIASIFPGAPKASMDSGEDWGDHAVLTIKDATALSYTLSPLEINDYLDHPNYDRFFARDVFYARMEAIEMAVRAGEIRTGEPDPTTGDICVLTKDVVKFFKEKSGKVLQESQGKLPSIARRKIRTDEPDLDSGKIGAPAENIAPCSETNSDKALQNNGEQSLSTVDARLFDNTYEYYARELAIAIRAWQAVTSNPNLKKAAKTQLTEWLKKNHPALSKQAKNRIAIVCNWNKKGGAPRTG